MHYRAATFISENALIFGLSAVALFLCLFWLVFTKKVFFSFHSAAAAQQNSNVASHRKECGGEEISLLFFHATISAISYQIREECAATHGDLLCCYHGDAVGI